MKREDREDNGRPGETRKTVDQVELEIFENWFVTCKLFRYKNWQIVYCG